MTKNIIEIVPVIDSLVKEEFRENSCSVLVVGFSERIGDIVLAFLKHPHVSVTIIDTFKSNSDNTLYSYIKEAVGDRVDRVIGEPKDKIGGMEKDKYSLFYLDASKDYLTSNLHFFNCKSIARNSSVIIWGSNSGDRARLWEGYRKDRHVYPHPALTPDSPSFAVGVVLSQPHIDGYLAGGARGGQVSAKRKEDESLLLAFHTPSIDVRGTCVALYDYAHYNETILGNKSIVLVPESGRRDSESIAVRKFTSRFRVIWYGESGESDLEDTLEKEGIDILYAIKYGKRDGVVSERVKTVVHCVFDLSEPHGDVYAAVSKQLSDKYAGDPNSLFVHPFVPHMIGLQPSTTRENMRASLGIPEDAIVFGRHGGRDTFDLDIAKRAIRRVVSRETDPLIYFLFVNTPRFIGENEKGGDRVIHLDKIVDSGEKNRFILSCDAMIHAQSLGETFGLSIGEFSVNNRRVICYGGEVWNDNYKTILGDKAIYYNNEDECYERLVGFSREEESGGEDKDWNCYKEYTPKRVMERFRRVFIEG